MPNPPKYVLPWTPRWLTDGATTLDQIEVLLDSAHDQIAAMRAEDVRLEAPVDDGHGMLFTYKPNVAKQFGMFPEPNSAGTPEETSMITQATEGIKRMQEATQGMKALNSTLSRSLQDAQGGMERLIEAKAIVHSPKAHVEHVRIKDNAIHMDLVFSYEVLGVNPHQARRMSLTINLIDNEEA